MRAVVVERARYSLLVQYLQYQTFAPFSLTSSPSLGSRECSQTAEAGFRRLGGFVDNEFVALVVEASVPSSGVVSQLLSKREEVSGVSAREDMLKP